MLYVIDEMFGVNSDEYKLCTRRSLFVRTQMARSVEHRSVRQVLSRRERPEATTVAQVKWPHQIAHNAEADSHLTTEVGAWGSGAAFVPEVSVSPRMMDARRAPRRPGRARAASQGRDMQVVLVHFAKIMKISCTVKRKILVQSCETRVVASSSRQRARAAETCTESHARPFPTCAESEQQTSSIMSEHFNSPIWSHC